MFGRHWEPARGRVVDKVVLGSGGYSDGVLVHAFVVDVQLANGQQLRARVEEPRIATDFWDPSIGQEVGVQVEARSGKVRFDKSDPAISYKAQHKARQAAFDARLQQGPNAPATGWPGAAPGVAGGAVPWSPAQVQARTMTPEEFQQVLTTISDRRAEPPH